MFKETTLKCMNICLASSRAFLLIGNMETTLNGISFQHVFKQAVILTSIRERIFLVLRVRNSKKIKKNIEEFCKLLIDFTDAFIMQLSRGSQ